MTDTCAKCGHLETLHGEPDGKCHSLTTCSPIPVQEWCKCTSFLARTRDPAPMTTDTKQPPDTESAPER